MSTASRLIHLQQAISCSTSPLHLHTATISPQTPQPPSLLRLPSPHRSSATSCCSPPALQLSACASGIGLSLPPPFGNRLVTKQLHLPLHPEICVPNHRSVGYLSSGVSFKPEYLIDSFIHFYRMRVDSVLGKVARKESAVLSLICVLTGVCISIVQSLTASCKRYAIFESMQFMYSRETLLSSSRSSGQRGCA